jgi:hypothetical protein
MIHGARIFRQSKQTGKDHGFSAKSVKEFIIVILINACA